METKSFFQFEIIITVLVSQIKQMSIFFNRLKLWVALARHNFQMVKKYII